MIEDELWLILGIVILLIIAVLIYLVFSNASAIEFFKQFMEAIRNVIRK
ncbi:MAG: hypothetical protein QW197_01940 [Candidatus Aenigmatarchaeota archaeon]